MKRLIPLLLVLSLGGCVATQAVFGFTITQNQLDVARSSYDAVVLAPAARYRQLRLCAKNETFIINQCRTHSLAATLQAADKDVAVGFAQVQSNITSGNNSGAVAAMQTLNIAISTATKIINDNQINILGSK